MMLMLSDCGGLLWPHHDGCIWLHLGGQLTLLKWHHHFKPHRSERPARGWGQFQPP